MDVSALPVRLPVTLPVRLPEKPSVEVTVPPETSIPPVVTSIPLLAVIIPITSKFVLFSDVSVPAIDTFPLTINSPMVAIPLTISDSDVTCSVPIPEIVVRPATIGLADR